MEVVIAMLIIIAILAIIIYGVSKSKNDEINENGNAVELSDEVVRKDIHSIAFWVKFFSIATLIGWGALIIFIIYMRSKM